MSTPDFIVIAGANGSGKTTLTKWARAFFQQAANLDPDAAAVDNSSDLGHREVAVNLVGQGIVLN